MAVMCSAMTLCTNLQNLLTFMVEICLLVGKTLDEDQNKGSLIPSKYMYMYMYVGLTDVI